MKRIIDISDKEYELYKLWAKSDNLCSPDTLMIANSLPYEDNWIPVSERLPEESLNSVIGWDAYRERCVFVQYIDGHFQITGSTESFNIVAWQPVPEPYMKEGKEE